MKTTLPHKFMLCLVVVCLGCTPPQQHPTAIANERQAITTMLNNFNAAAASANYTNYFNCFTNDAVFIGTDATESWTKKSFMLWAKPHFEAKKTWNFTAVKRTIYFGTSNDIAWFDELLNTQMKICRGSGVVVKQNNEWKIQHYVLSITIPNSLSKVVVQQKATLDDSLLRTIIAQ